MCILLKIKVIFNAQPSHKLWDGFHTASWFISPPKIVFISFDLGIHLAQVMGSFAMISITLT